MISIYLDEFCEEYPHNLIPTPGYWVECSRQKINLIASQQAPIWDESDSEHEEEEEEEVLGTGNDAYLEHPECSDLYEDEEESELSPK